MIVVTLIYHFLMHIDSEAIAILEGQRAAKQAGCSCIHMESDSRMDIEAIDRAMNSPWQMLNCVRNIHDLASTFQPITFSHIYRDANRPANRLANFAQTTKYQLHLYVEGKLTF